MFAPPFLFGVFFGGGGAEEEGDFGERGESKRGRGEKEKTCEKERSTRYFAIWGSSGKKHRIFCDLGLLRKEA